MPNQKLNRKARCFIVMGVSGSGKSTIAKRLANRLTARFIDGDDHHPAENIAKMAKGSALNDQDRLPWLAGLAKISRDCLENGQQVVLVCSALKKSYRNIFRQQLHDCQFILLHGDYELIYQRLKEREGHFMKANMLKTQFSTLELPDAEETDVVTYDIAASIDSIIEQAVQLDID